MKKFLMAICALAVATTVASAAVGVAWSTVNWGENHLGDGSGSGNAILDANSVLWQLIYAGADGLIDAIPNDPTITATTAFGDDAVWAYRTLAETDDGTFVTASQDGTIWDVWMMEQAGGGSTVYTDLSWNTAGFVYQRVFESINPIVGTWYYESSLTALNTGYDPGAPSTMTLCYTVGGDAFVPNQQVTSVPEPATMGLLGLGALVMAIRRRRA